MKDPDLLYAMAYLLLLSIAAIGIFSARGCVEAETRSTAAVRIECLKHNTARDCEHLP